MQIFIKTTSGKTITLDVEATDTIQETKIKLLQKEYPGGDEVGFISNTRLIFKGNILRNEDTIGGKGITKECTLHAVVPPVVSVVARDEVSEGLRIVLRGHLNTIIHGLQDKSFVFIGIGSCDGGHGTDSIKKQQCPDAILNWCKVNDWSLTILLIDQEFGGTTNPQIYDVDKAWIKTASADEITKLAKYSYAGLESKFKLFTYSLSVPEYGALGIKAGMRGTLVGLGHVAVFNVIALTDKLTNVCLVSGNFYEDHKNQYSTYGCDETLLACGVIPNPL